MPEPTDAIAERLDADRRALLDLSLRNPLLNYRPRRRSLTIVGESPAELVRILVREGKRMAFDPAPDPPPEADRPEGDEAPLELPPADPTDLNLQTDATADALQDRLLAIDSAARGSVEELGVNTLYLALGMLRWSEPDNGRRTPRAPLILLPVGLERRNARERFRLRYPGDDLETNLSLAEKLRRSFGVDLPELPDADDLDADRYFDAVAEAIAGREGWQVERDAVALGFFSFNRLLMYRDLDADLWPEGAGPGTHPLVARLLGGGLDDEEGAPSIGEDEPLDARLGPLDVRPVLDADGSQMLALADAADGRTMVIQGPPGTGKSQTIANLIAEAVGRGRSVLFVAEKAAALEVVRRRLDAVGLGAACLELHSHRTRRRDVLDELRRTLQLGRPATGPAEDDARVLVDHRDRLNAVAAAMNAPIGSTSASPYQAIGDLLLHREALDGAVPPSLDVPGLDEWTDAEYRTRELLVEQLRARLADVRVPLDHPIRRSVRSVWTATATADLARRAEAARAATLEVRSIAAELAGALGIEPPRDRAGAEAIVELARPPRDGRDLGDVPLGDDDWERRGADVDDLLTAGGSLAALHDCYDEVLLPEAWGRDLVETRETLNTVGRRWWRWLSDRQGVALFRLATLCRAAPPRSPEERLTLVDAIIESQRKRSVIQRHACLAGRLFGARWRGEASDWLTLSEIAGRARRLGESAREGRLPAGAIAAAADVEAGRRAAPMADRLRSALDEQVAALRSLAEASGLAASDEGPPAEWLDPPFDAVFARIAEAADRGDDLHAVALVNQRAAACREAGLGAVVDAALAWPDASRHLTVAFRARRCEALLDRAVRERPALAGFSGDDQEELVRRFAALDVAVLGHNRAWAASTHWAGVPRHRAAAGDLALLRRELEKKSRHLPIRRLFEGAGRSIQKVKPVFLMSPLSVASYLKPGELTFDLVVFDEASQVRPVDALGALLRGRQAIVVGDDRQLPPTTFFDRLTASDEPGDDEDDAGAPPVDALESVLGLFLAQGAPRRMLRWHYRSRHESLIAVSNRRFYDDRLIVFPGPLADRSELGLVLRHLPETVYDRGGSRTNPAEASAVAEAVMDFAREQVGRSPAERRTLGVAAFSTAQAGAIARRLERLRRADPSCEPFFAEEGAEPFFVKNLESVQGDERDVVFISVGYGRDADGRVAMNFGPLNGEGGERRLNVLITRARRRCVVFSNLTGADIDAGRTSSTGVRALKTFLHYAQHGRFEGPGPDREAAGPQSDPAFLQVIADALRRAGFDVARGLGTAEARVDLAVLDPERPGHYRLGVLCDGPSYAAPRSSRDRDRVRPAVLEGLGWRLVRCWSADWWHDPDGRAARLVATAESDEAAKAAADALATHLHPSGVDRVAVAEAEAEQALPPYEVARLDAGPDGADPAAMESEALAAWVAEVVRVEGPVHEAEVARRIADASGLKRLAGRAKEAIEAAIAAEGGPTRRGPFLWPVGLDRAEPRDRSGLATASRRLDYVSPEELAAAVERVVADALGIAPDDLPTAVLRRLGFPRTSEEMRTRVASVVAERVAAGRLIRQGEHLVAAPTAEGADERPGVSAAPRRSPD